MQTTNDHATVPPSRPPAEGARDGTPAARLVEGDPPRLKLTRRREEARAALGEGWRPPAPSRATRTWAPKSQGSMRALLASGGTLVACESGMEWRAKVVAEAHPRVVALREQPEPVTYVVDGEERSHTPDFECRTVEGERRALVVKPDGRAARAERLVEVLNEQRAGGVDHFHRVGDTKLVRSVVRRADLIGWVRRDGPASGDPEVVRMRAVVTGPMTIAEAVAASGDEGAGFRAVVRLVIDGVVRVRDGWSISHERTIEPVRGDEEGRA